MCESEQDVFKLISLCDYFQLVPGTSVFAGFAIFSILGHMAHIYKMPVGKVVKEGQIHIIPLDFEKNINRLLNVP